MTAATFAAVLGAYVVGHQAADYWVQTDYQATHKGLPGWPGRWACARHVLTYTATLTVCLAVTAWWVGFAVSPIDAAAGLAVSAVTHYAADRRAPLEWLANRLGSGPFYRSGTGLASGAAYLDQSWHWVWLGAAALVTSGHPW